MPNTKALILVDLENEWRDKNSAYYIGDLTDLMANTNHLIDYCRKQDYKIILIRHIDKDGKAFAEGSNNTELLPELHLEDSDVTITKYAIGSFYKTNLEKELAGIEDIVVSGILTNLCVRSLVSDVYDREFNITIIEDCCVALDEETHKFTLKDLKSTREEIEIKRLDNFI